MKPVTQQVMKKTSRTPSTATSAVADKWRDPFIEDLHAVRASLVAKANGNIHQLVLNARQTASKLGFSA
jgi:hypothetical protein